MSNPTPLTPTPRPSSHLLVALAWLVVALPAAWGLYRTAMNAAPLILHDLAPVTTPAPVVAPPAR